MSLAPHRVPVLAVRVAGEDHRARGRARGALLADQVRRTAQDYVDLFADLGIDEGDTLEAAMTSLEALHAWDPDLHAEVSGIAEGAGLRLLDVGRTLARTEILTLAPAAPGECSTLAHQGTGRAASVQTWDWYARFAGCWHVHRVDPLPGEVAHAGFAEAGMPGKIGLNAAGVGVHLNILKHADDAPGGVPVHALLARVLSTATTVEEALDVLRSADVTSSSVITVVGPDRVAMVELAPGRTQVLDGEGWRLHTNHFLAPELQDGARLLTPDSDTHDRLAWLRDSVAGAPEPGTSEDLVPLLCSPPQDHGVALLPDERLPEAQQLATLVTVRLDPGERTVRVSPGIPQHARAVGLTYHL